MKPALTFNRLQTRSQVQVIGVGQNHIGLELFQKLMRHGLDSTSGPDRHEDRGLNLPVRGCEDSLTSMGLFVSSFNPKKIG